MVGCSGDSHRWCWRRGSGRLGHAPVSPEDAGAEDEQQGDDGEFGAADALLTAIAVVIGDDKDDGQADQKCEERDLAELCRPLEGVADVLKTLQESPGSGDVE